MPAGTIDFKRRLLTKAGLFLAAKALLGRGPDLALAASAPAHNKDWSAGDVEAFRQVIAQEMVSAAGKPLWVLDGQGMDVLRKEMAQKNMLSEALGSVQIDEMARTHVGTPVLDDWAMIVAKASNPALAAGQTPSDLAQTLSKHPMAIASALTAAKDKSGFEAKAWKEPAGFIIAEGTGYAGARAGSIGPDSAALKDTLNLIAPEAEVPVKLKEQINAFMFLHESTHVGDEALRGHYLQFENEFMARVRPSASSAEAKNTMESETIADLGAAARLYKITGDTAAIEAIMHYRTLRTACRNEKHHATQFELGRWLNGVKGTKEHPCVAPDDIEQTWMETKLVLRNKRDQIWPDGAVPDMAQQKEAYYVGGICKAAKMGLYDSASTDVKSMVQSLQRAVDYAQNLSPQAARHYDLGPATAAANPQETLPQGQTKTAASLSRRSFLKGCFPTPTA